MLSDNNKISQRQLLCLLVLDVFGTGVLTLPRKASEHAGQYGWLIVVGATVLALLCAFIITTLGRMFPEDSFPVYCSKIMTRPVGIVISLGFLVKILIYLALELRLFGEILKETLLPNTPFPIVFFCLASVAAFAAAKGIETRARIGELLIPIVLIPLAVLLILAFFDVDFTNLTPVMTISHNVFSDNAFFPASLAIGSLWAGISFTGLEFVLFAHPYVENEDDLRKGVLWTTVSVGLLMLVITVLTLAKFGVDGARLQMWPVLELMKMLRLPGSFIERQDAFVMSFWIISVFSITGAGLFFSSLLLQNIAGRGRQSYYILLSLPVIFVLSQLPENITTAYALLDLLFITFGTAYLFFIPLLLLLVAWVRGIGEKR